MSTHPQQMSSAVCRICIAPVINSDIIKEFKRHDKNPVCTHCWEHHRPVMRTTGGCKPKWRYDYTHSKCECKYDNPYLTRQRERIEKEHADKLAQAQSELKTKCNSNTLANDYVCCDDAIHLMAHNDSPRSNHHYDIAAHAAAVGIFFEKHPITDVTRANASVAAMLTAIRRNFIANPSGRAGEPLSRGVTIPEHDGWASSNVPSPMWPHGAQAAPQAEIDRLNATVTDLDEKKQKNAKALSDRSFWIQKCVVDGQCSLCPQGVRAQMLYGGVYCGNHFCRHCCIPRHGLECAKCYRYS